MDQAEQAQAAPAAEAQGGVKRSAEDALDAANGDGAAKQARVDAGAEALAAAASEAARADGAEAGANEAGTSRTEATQSTELAEQPVEPAAAAEPDTSTTPATTESGSALPTETRTELDGPAADAAGSTGTSSADVVEAQSSELPAAAPAAPAADAAAAADSQPQETAVQPVQTDAPSVPATGSEAASSADLSVPPLERPAARAMLQEVDALLKKELTFLREIETKYGNRPGANGKPAGARKRRSESRANALVEPLAMDLSGSASVMDSQFRSPRTPKPNSRWTQPKVTRGVSAALRPFVQVLDRMMKHRDAAGFNLPVNQLWSMEMLPGYYDVVKRPMDLGTIKTRLNEGHYGDNPEAFAADVRLVWKNCMTYNNPDTEFHHTADRMRLLFEQAYKAASEKSAAQQEKEELKRQSSQAAQARQSRPKAEPKPKPKPKPAARASKKQSQPKKKDKSKKKKKDKKYANSGLDAVEMMNANLQRVLSRMGGAPAEPAEEKVPTRTMELWEKERLVKMMDKLEPDKFGTALSIIKQSHRVNLEEVESDEEVTIDIDTLDSKTLWKLHKYVEDNIPKKKKQSKKMSQAEKQRLDRERISQREQSLREELSQLQGNLAAAAAGSDSSSSDSSSDSDSD